MSNYVYRVHPAINIARVGNSDEYYIAPETMAGLPIPGVDPPATGGLPIKPDTESETITFVTSTVLSNGRLLVSKSTNTRHRPRKPIPTEAVRKYRSGAR